MWKRYILYIILTVTAIVTEEIPPQCDSSVTGNAEFVLILSKNAFSRSAEVNIMLQQL